jgi:hypothetical protein
MRIYRLFKPGPRSHSTTGTALLEAPLLARLTRIPSYREASPGLIAELSRARRYERPLSVLVLRWMHSATGGRPGEHSDDGAYPELMIALLLGAVLPGSVREIDQVCHDAAAGRYIMVMPELRKTQAFFAVRRLDALLKTRIPVPAFVGVSEFPPDGLTLEALVAAADSMCQTNLSRAVSSR